MPLPRSALFRSLPKSQSYCRACRQGTKSAKWQRSQRRGYASGGEGGSSGAGGSTGLTSELSWAIPAVGITIPVTYWVLQSGPKGPILNHPMPGEHWHGEGEEHEEGEEEEKGQGEEGGEGEEKQDDGEQREQKNEDGEQGEQKNEGQKGESGESKEQSEGGDSKADADSEPKSKDEGQDSNAPAPASDSSSDEGENKENEAPAGNNSDSGAKVSGKRMSNDPDDRHLKVKNSAGESVPANQRTELEKGPQGQTRLHMPDAKGGGKLRSESARGMVQGRAEGSDEGESIGDVKDGSKSAVGGQTSSQQKGVSNTDTKYSVDLMKDPEKSKKSEGVPETAKIQGTVNPGRKAT